VTTFNHTVRKIRFTLRLNQLQFAHRLGVSQGRVSKWENWPRSFRPHPSTKVRLLALAMEADELRARR